MRMGSCEISFECVSVDKSKLTKLQLLEKQKQHGKARARRGKLKNQRNSGRTTTTMMKNDEEEEAEEQRVTTMLVKI